MSLTHDVRTVRTDEAAAVPGPSPANGPWLDSWYVDATKHDAAPRLIDFASGVSRRHERPRRLGRAAVVSFILHAAALAAAAQAPLRRFAWELRLPQGRNSVALQASISSPRTESQPTARLEPARLDVNEPAESRRAAEPPAVTAAPVATDPPERRRPPQAEAVRVAAAENPAPPEIFEPPPLRRTVEARLPLHELKTSVESVAAAPAAASAGAQTSTPPTEIVSVKPIYPPAALAAGWEGVVKLYVRLNDRGEVVASEVFQSSGHALLDQAALDVIYRWRFTPPDGARGVAAEFIKPMPFRIVR